MSPLQWELAWTDENEGAGERLALPAGLEWRPVAVPCSVQNSPFGLPPETLYQRDNIQSVAWMTGKTWLFRTAFDVPAIGPDGEAATRRPPVLGFAVTWQAGERQEGKGQEESSFFEKKEAKKLYPWLRPLRGEGEA